MADDIAFDRSSEGLIVRIDEDRPLPVGEWTSRGPAGTGALIRLRDDGGAVECEDGSALCVSWKSIAGLTSDELRYIGLPDAAPFALEVVANGAIHDDGFEIRCGYIRDGRRVIGVQREGAWLHVAGDDFLLLEPLYSIADAIDRFNRAEESDTESRMLRWGRIAAMLPADAVVDDDNLRSLKIFVASSFEIDPFVNDKGEPDFDPVVGRHETRVNEAGEEEQVFAPGLPLARQKEFARRFRGLSRVQHRYLAGGGSYVVLTPEIERALGVVRRAQDGSPDERRDFLRNVSGYLRGAFEDDDGDAVDLDSIFSDEGLSERVKGVGIWVDKVLPWIKLAKEPWLPPEELGILIGGERVVIPPEELESVLDLVLLGRAVPSWLPFSFPRRLPVRWMTRSRSKRCELPLTSSSALDSRTSWSIGFVAPRGSSVWCSGLGSCWPLPGAASTGIWPRTWAWTPVRWAAGGGAGRRPESVCRRPKKAPALRTCLGVSPRRWWMPRARAGRGSSPPSKSSKSSPSPVSPPRTRSVRCPTGPLERWPKRR